MCFKIIISIVTKVFIFKVSIAITNLEIWFSQHNLMSNLVISINKLNHVDQTLNATNQVSIMQYPRDM